MMKRSLLFSALFAVPFLTAPVFAPLESVLDRLREADGLAFDYDGD